MYENVTRVVGATSSEGSLVIIAQSFYTMRTVSESEFSFQIADAQPHWIFCEDTEYTRSS